MSFGESKLTTKREEREFKDHGRLELSEAFINKVHHLHTKIGSIEWSGVLEFKKKEGKLNDPKTLVFEVIDFLPMDIGTSGYTEYEYNAADIKLQDFMFNAAEKGNKLGHLHTHHSMGAFFSGTDMDELHINSENHNYYLSLIVNFKDFTEWVAAIAIRATDTTVGHKKVSGELKTITTWKDEEGKDENLEEVVDFAKDEEINDKEDILYIIKLDLVADQKAVDLISRLKYIKESKTPPVYKYSGHHNNYGNLYKEAEKRRLGSHVGYAYHGEDEDDVQEFQGKLPFEKADESKASEKSKSHKGNKKFSPAEEFTPGKVRTILIRILAQDKKCNDMLDAVIFRMANEDDENNVLTVLMAIEENFEAYLKRYFNKGLDPIDLHYISKSMLELLEPYATIKFVAEVKEIIEDYILAYTIRETNIA